MNKEIKESDVQTLCFYISVSGKCIWVYECESGYFYGGVGCILFSRWLSHCFRFAPRFETKEDALNVAKLSVLRGAPVPSGVLPLGVLIRASEFSSKCLPKINDLPFEL